jgi:hypothetical protein
MLPWAIGALAIAALPSISCCAAAAAEDDVTKRSFGRRRSITAAGAGT